MGNPGFFLQQKIMDLGLAGQEFTLLEKCATKALQRAVKVKGWKKLKNPVTKVAIPEGPVQCRVPVTFMLKIINLKY